jgi:hypothetical protein
MENTLIPNSAIEKEDFALFSFVDTPEESRFLINEHSRICGGGKPQSKPQRKPK